MNRDELKQRVDAIVALERDEVQHEMEDDLHRDVIGEFCPEWVKDEIHRLNAADFCRWMA